MKSFELVPAGPAAYWVLIPALVTLVLAAVPLAWLAVSARHGGSVDVSTDGIRLNVPMYSRGIPAASLAAAQARVVDLTTTRELRPWLRTNGVGLPGYRAGWFRLQDGEKALVSVRGVNYFCRLATTISAGEGPAKECGSRPDRTR